MVPLLPARLEGDGIVLRRWLVSDAETIARAVAESLEHLRPWMDWIAYEPLSLAQRRAMIRQWSKGDDVLVGIFRDGQVVGSAGLHRRIGPGGLEIGYWVHPAHTRRGFATSAARLLADAALSLPAITHVEIHHDKANTASAGVPAKLGFELIGETPDRIEAPAEVGIECVWRMDRQRWERLRALPLAPHDPVR
jgi:ribosomal-protein-serine acetyltransferase